MKLRLAFFETASGSFAGSGLSGLSIRPLVAFFETAPGSFAGSGIPGSLNPPFSRWDDFLTIEIIGVALLKSQCSFLARSFWTARGFSAAEGKIRGQNFLTGRPETSRVREKIQVQRERQAAERKTMATKRASTSTLSSAGQKKQKVLVQNIDDVTNKAGDIVQSAEQTLNDANALKKFSDTLKKNFEDVQGEYNSVRGSVEAALDTLREEKSEVEQDLKKYKKEAADAKASLASKTNELLALVQQNGTDKAAWEARVKELGEEINGLKQTVESHKPQIETLNKEKKEIQTQLDAKVTELSNLKNDHLTEMQERLARAETEAEANRLSVKEITEKKEAAFQKLAGFDKMVKDFSAAFQAMKEEIQNNYDAAIEAYKPREEAPAASSSSSNIPDSASQVSDGFDSTYSSESYNFGRGGQRTPLSDSFMGFAALDNARRFDEFSIFLTTKRKNFEASKQQAQAFFEDFFTVNKQSKKIRGAPLKLINDFLQEFFSVRVDPTAAQDKGSVLSKSNEVVSQFYTYVSNRVQLASKNKTSFLGMVRSDMLA